MQTSQMVCTFFSDKFLYLLKSLIDFSIKGTCPNKLSETTFNLDNATVYISSEPNENY